jgi:PKD repeat protein
MQIPCFLKLSSAFSYLTKTKMPRARGSRGLAPVAALLTALALPLMASAQSGASPNLTAREKGGQFQLQLRGQSNQIYEIEASTNLVNWTILAQRAGGPGTVTITDPQASQFNRRFYRAVAPGPSNTLTGLGEDNYAPDKILVKPKAGVTLSALNLSLGVQVLNVFSAIGNLQVVKVPSGTTASTLIALYQQSGLVQYAEPDFYVRALLTPNDPGYPQLWGFHNTGQFGGVSGADIDAPDAWSLQHDAGSSIVAVVDTGVRYTHQDLAANMWHNPQENQDGYTNDLYGINLVANGRGNGDPWDDEGHGTHCAGTIGAAGNNGMGVVGVAWQVQIMACKFLDTNGLGTIDAAIQCMDFARTHGANIVNASWGSFTFTSQSLHDAVASLRDAGILFVAACGNSAANNDATPLYPASYSDLDNVIAVAATDESDNLASFSDYGATNVDLGAPGVQIGSCWNGSDSDYEYDDGTSMAAAMVSGAAAVMKAHFPNENYLQIKQQLLANVDSRPALQGKSISGGRLNLYKALASGAPPTLTASFSANPTSGPAPLTVQFTDASTGNPTSWNWTFGDGATSTVESPSHAYTNIGNFTVTLTIANGSQTSSANQTITVTNGSSSTPPVITLTTTQPDAYESGQAPGVITFHRTGDTSQAYEVYWTFSGTAVNGVDYEQLPTNSPFPAGQADATLTITPIDHGPESNKTVIVTLAPGPAYQIGASNSATVLIHGYQQASGPTASFTASPTSGQAPLTVQFTDTSTGNPTNWAWNFGDGATSATQSPSHSYNSAGSFTATLTVTGNGQTSSTSHTITVTNAPAPVTAAFSASPNSGQAPLTVQFTDQSSGPVTAWSWNFGDGATSTTQSPSHTYTSAGSFTTTLTITGNGQSSSTSHTIVVTNAPPPPATVTVTATQSLATSLTPGVFTVTRSNANVSSGLVVNYSLGGTAQNGVDYQTLNGSVLIPAGYTSATVVVQPLGLLNVLKTVVLTISPEPSYAVGSPNSATVEIVASLSL